MKDRHLSKAEMVRGMHTFTQECDPMSHSVDYTVPKVKWDLRTCGTDQVFCAALMAHCITARARFLSVSGNLS
jgi:hypothetical protein